MYDSKKVKSHDKHRFKDLFIEGHNYSKWFHIQDDEEPDNEESDDDKTLDGDQEEIADLSFIIFHL